MLPQYLLFLIFFNAVGDGGAAFLMATAAGSSYRNGAYRSSLRVDNTGRPFSVNQNQNPKSSLKAKTSQGSGIRKSSPAALGGGSAGAVKDDGGGK